MTKSYLELIRFKTFEERFRYLSLIGSVGSTTFGYDRYLNQLLYHSKEWRRTRDDIIVRDEACDLGIPDRLIHSRILIHHINPITIEDVEYNNPCVFDPNNLICTTHDTHNALHFGDESQLLQLPKTRTKGDTRLW